jgi:group I intron endonuclease
MGIKISGIYRILNTQNAKYYIGSSTSIVARWNTHKHLLRKGIHQNGHLQGAWNKYGEEAFKFEIIEQTESNKLIAREQFYKNLYKSYNPVFGYDMLEIAGSTTGYKHTPIAKFKISEALRKRKGKKVSPEEKERLRNLRLGDKPSIETLQKRSKSCKETWFIKKNIQGMVKLYVDDLRPAPDETWHVVRSNTEAIRILSTGYVLVLSVDHDITITKKDKDGHTIPVSDSDGNLVTCPETFEPTIRYAAILPENLRPKIIKCHSANPEAYNIYSDILVEKGLQLDR